jgi:hypothetical protein
MRRCYSVVLCSLPAIRLSSGTDTGDMKRRDQMGSSMAACAPWESGISRTTSTWREMFTVYQGGGVVLSLHPLISSPGPRLITSAVDRNHLPAEPTVARHVHLRPHPLHIHIHHLPLFPPLPSPLPTPRTPLCPPSVSPSTALAPVPPARVAAQQVHRTDQRGGAVQG